jgi:hypothetical protein
LQWNIWTFNMPIKLNIPLPSKGLVVDRPAEYVDSRSAASIQNMELNRSIIRKRSGTEALGASLAERVQRYFELQVGTVTRLFRVGLTKLQDLNKTTEVWTSATATPLTGAQNNQISYAFPVLSGEKIAVYTNGVDNIRKVSITGNDANLGGTPPKAKFVIAFGPYLVLLNVTDGGNDSPRRVQWSDTGDPEVWTGGNSGSTDLLEGPSDITGGGTFGNFITVHTRTSIYVGQLVTTSDVFRFDRKATGVGTVAEATIQNLPSGEQIFLAADGIHKFNGITAPLIESAVQDELREEMSPIYLYKSQSVFVAELDEYWVCVATGSDTEPQTVYKYNWRTGQVYKDLRANLTALSAYTNDGGSTSWDEMVGTWDANTNLWNSGGLQNLNPAIIFGDSTGVSSERTSATDDAGTIISSNWDTKDFTAEDLGIPDIDRIIRWKGLEIWAKGNEMSVSYSTDGGTSWNLASTLTLGSDYPTDTSPLNSYFDVVSSRIRFRFSNNELAETFTLKKYQIEATPREARK